jgi:preprotein translocase subunit SecF
MSAGSALERVRRTHRIGIALLALVAILLTGCGGNPLQTAIDMSGRLAQDGFRDSNVNLRTTNRGDIVVVTSTGHDRLSDQDAYIRAGELVWTQLPLRFDEIQIQVGPDGVHADRDDLTATFGPRDPALDAQTIGGAIGGGLATVGLIALGVFLVLLVLVVLLIVWLVRRSRRRRPPGPPPPYGPPQGYRFPPGPPPAGLSGAPPR